MATARGTSTIDFGPIASPATSAEVTVSGQVGLVAGAGTQVEAWLRLEATAEHSVEEIRAHGPRVIAGNVTTGSFTIYAEASQLREYGTFNVDWIWVV